MSELEVLRIERDQARARYERTVQILLGIHALLYPKPVTVGDVTHVFHLNEAKANEWMHALSERIRAIPDELEKTNV